MSIPPHEGIVLLENSCKDFLNIYPERRPVSEISIKHGNRNKVLDGIKKVSFNQRKIFYEGVRELTLKNSNNEYILFYNKNTNNISYFVNIIDNNIPHIKVYQLEKIKFEVIKEGIFTIKYIIVPKKELYYTNIKVEKINSSLEHKLIITEFDNSQIEIATDNSIYNFLNTQSFTINEKKFIDYNKQKSLNYIKNGEDYQLIFGDNFFTFNFNEFEIFQSSIDKITIAFP